MEEKKVEWSKELVQTNKKSLLSKVVSINSHHKQIDIVYDDYDDDVDHEGAAIGLNEGISISCSHSTRQTNLSVCVCFGIHTTLNVSSCK